MTSSFAEDQQAQPNADESGEGRARVPGTDTHGRANPVAADPVADPWRPAARGQVAPFIVMEVMRAANARAAAGGDVLHLEIGQPSTPAPVGVVAAAGAALAGDRLGYTDAFGLPDLRAAIAGWYGERYGLALDLGRIAVTTGSSAGFLLAFLAAFEPGDRVALASPGYPAYRNILKATGLVPVEVETGPETRYQPTPAQLEALDPPLKGLIVASPGNPTGSMIPPADLAALARWCEGRGVRLISDEIYHGLEYGEVASRSALGSSDRAVVVNSFSKYFSMTGWRLGWLVLPPELVRPVECLTQNLYISPPTLSQHAAIAAFTCRGELEGHVARYRRNRDRLLADLAQAGITTIAPPDGAFYLYADIGHLTADSPAFCRDLLAVTGVAVTPGVDFDPVRGHRFIRLSFAGAEAEIAEAGRRLGTFIAGRGRDFT